MLCSETLPVEYLGEKPLCMNQYYQVLSSCRIPGLKKDSVVNHARSSPPPKHVTVVHNCQVRTSTAVSFIRINRTVVVGVYKDCNCALLCVFLKQFFVLDVYNSDGSPLTAEQLCVQLEDICNSSQQTNTEPVGILTTLDRDSWGKTYANLIKGQYFFFFV